MQEEPLSEPGRGRMTADSKARALRPDPAEAGPPTIPAGLERALLAAIVDNSDDAIASKDLTGVVTSWNRAAERLFGYTAQEMIGRPIAVLAAPGREDEMPAILERIRRGERVDHFETVRRRKNGSLVEIALTVSPIRDQGGQIVGASKIARDIGDRRQAEQARELTWIIHWGVWYGRFGAALGVAVRGAEGAMVGAGGGRCRARLGHAAPGSRRPRGTGGKQREALPIGVAARQRQLDAGRQLGDPAGHLDEGEPERVELGIAPERPLRC